MLSPVNLSCCHVMLTVSDIDVAKEFYLSKLGLDEIEVYPKFFAARAGDVRFSFFVGGQKHGPEHDSTVSVILRTEDITESVSKLAKSGVVFEGEVSEAPNFMRFVSFLDPDGNRLYLAQYLADPFSAA